MGIVLTGFLNKYMDVMGIALEQESLDSVYNILKDTDWEIGKGASSELKVTETIKPTQKDNLLTYLKIAGQAPRAIRLETVG